MSAPSSSTRVSIGMPIYNAERYLEETLDSVLAQTYEDFVLYISDNASTDATETICREYANKDKRIKYIRNQTNVGAAKNYEVCFAPATTEYFRWQNADDPIEPTLIERCIEALDQNPDAVLAYGQANFIDENGKLIEPFVNELDVSQDTPAQRMIAVIDGIGIQNQMYGLMRRKPLSNTALLGNYVAADLNLITELALYGKFIVINEHLFNRRMHPDCSSWDRDSEEKQRDFWDPSKRKLVMQTWRGIYEYFKAVLRAPIAQNQRLQASRYFVKVAYWRRDKMFKELSELIRFGLLKSK